MSGLSTSAVAQEAASPTLPPRADLIDEMPRQMGGFEPDIVITRGVEHLANLDPADPADAETLAELQRLFDETGVTVEDMSTGYALAAVDDFFSFVIAIRLDGAKPGTLLPAYLPILMNDLIEPVVVERAVGDKPVLVITSEGADREPVDLYVYDAGDTIWMAQGPDDVVFFAITDLP